ncbi:transposase, partial [Chloroflexota bacterium]
MIRYHVGIDVGKRKHHACVHDTVEDRYTKIFSYAVDRQGFESFLFFLRRQGPVEEVLVGVEASGPYALTIGNFLL